MMKKKSLLPKKTPSKKKQRAGVWINGLSGRMGSDISRLLEDHPTLRLLGGSDHKSRGEAWSQLETSRLVIDFSTSEGNKLLLSKASKLYGLKILIGTTGLSKDLIDAWRKIAGKQGHTVLLAPNTSFGVYTLAHHIGSIAAALTAEDWDIELVETHHNKKVDAPSGTALFLAKMIQKACPEHKIITARSGARAPKSIGVHAVRGGGVFGEHEVRFIGSHEEIYVGHRAFSRTLFAQGALSLGEKLISSEQTGLIFIEDIKN